MIQFLKQETDNSAFELLIDASIFPKDIVLKASYNFLDKGYFFFKLNDDKNIILQFTPKTGVSEKPETIIGNFYDELIGVHLRTELEKENKVIREAIITGAIAHSIDAKGFVSIDTNTKDTMRRDNNENSRQIDFDKDIDDILKEIENDPELKIDEAEIEKILKEIEEETQAEIAASTKITIDTNQVENAKKMFQSRK